MILQLFMYLPEVKKQAAKQFKIENCGCSY